MVPAPPLARQADRIIHAPEGVHVEALAELEVELAVSPTASGVEGVLHRMAPWHGLLGQSHADFPGDTLVAVARLTCGHKTGGLSVKAERQG